MQSRPALPVEGARQQSGRARRRLSGSPAGPAAERPWTDEDRHLYQRHRWRSEGYHGEAKTRYGLARGVRRGLQNMRIQALLTAAAVNLERLAAALLAELLLLRTGFAVIAAIANGHRPGGPMAAPFFNDPRVRWIRNALAHVPKGQGNEFKGAHVELEEIRHTTMEIHQDYVWSSLKIGNPPAYQTRHGGRLAFTPE